LARVTPLATLTIGRPNAFLITWQIISSRSIPSRELRRPYARRTRYLGLVDSIGNPDDHESPVEAFLEQPAYHADEDTVEPQQVSTPIKPTGSPWQRLRRRFSHFMYEKEPSQYSSIAPRTPDGKRTKIFFFNGNGRGR